MEKYTESDGYSFLINDRPAKIQSIELDRVGWKIKSLFRLRIDGDISETFNTLEIQSSKEPRRFIRFFNGKYSDSENLIWLAYLGVKRF